MTALVVVLALALVAVVVVAATIWRRLRLAEERVEELEGERSALLGAFDAAGLVAPVLALDRSGRTLRVARQAARAVIGTAGLLRSGGFSQLLDASLEELGRWVDADREEIEQWAGPEGLVTVLFSDIEGSTARNEELGDDAWLKVLRAHDALVRTEVTRREGHVVKNQGDGYMVVFAQALPALQAAVAIQRRLERGRNRQLRAAGVRVRMGLHTGQVVSHEGDYFGRNVALAARVAAQAEGGQILVTDEVRAIVSGAAPAPIAFAPLEPVELKGLSGPFQLWSVEL